MKTLKTITTFSSTWNTNIKVIIVATNTEIRKVVPSIIEQQEEHNSEYKLYKNMETAREFNSEI